MLTVGVGLGTGFCGAGFCGEIVTAALEFVSAKALTAERQTDRRTSVVLMAGFTRD
jgi:hypothetical protein